MTTDQDAEAIRHLRGRVQSLEAENKRLKAKLEDRKDDDDARSGNGSDSGMESEATAESGSETAEDGTTRDNESNCGSESGGSSVEKSNRET